MYKPTKGSLKHVEFVMEDILKTSKNLCNTLFSFERGSIMNKLSVNERAAVYDAVGKLSASIPRLENSVSIIKGMDPIPSIFEAFSTSNQSKKE